MRRLSLALGLAFFFLIVSSIPAGDDKTGDPLPAGAVGRLGSTRLRHEWGGAWSVAITPDGKTIISAGEDNAIRLWDAATGKALRVIGLGKESPRRMVISEDGKRLAADLGQAIHVWEVGTGKEVRKLQGHEGRVNALAFSPDGKTLASGGADRTVRLWDLDTGKESLQFKPDTEEVASLHFAPPGKLLASGHVKGQVCILDTDKGKVLQNFKGTAHMAIVAFSPDGKTLASGGNDNSARLWNAATGKALQIFKDRRWGYVRSVRVMPDCQSVALLCAGDSFKPGGNVADVRFFRLRDGTETRKLPAALQSANTMAFSADADLLAVAGNGDGVTVYDMANEKVAHRLGTKDDGTIWGLAFAADGKTLAAVGEKVHLWDATTGKERATLEGVEGRGQAVAFSPNGKQVAIACEDARVRTWETASGKLLRTIAPVPPEVGRRQSTRALAFSPDGKLLATTGSCGTVLLWDMTR